MERQYKLQGSKKKINLQEKLRSLLALLLLAIVHIGGVTVSRKPSESHGIPIRVPELIDLDFQVLSKPESRDGTEEDLIRESRLVFLAPNREAGYQVSNTAPHAVPDVVVLRPELPDIFIPVESALLGVRIGPASLVDLQGTSGLLFQDADRVICLFTDYLE